MKKHYLLISLHRLSLCGLFAILLFSRSTFAQKKEKIMELEEFIAEESSVEEEHSLSPMARPVDSVFGEDLKVIDIPRAVTVITTEAMEQFNLKNFDDLEKIGAGTQRVNFYGIPGTPQLRGAKAGTYIDGMLRAFNRNVMPLSFGSLESLDLVKGPTPAELTPSEVGGYVNTIPKSPYFDKFRGSFSVSAGRWNDFSIDADAGGPFLLGKKPAAFRLSFHRRDADSYYRDHEDTETSFYAAIKLKLRDGVTIFTGGEYFDFNFNENPGWNRVTQQLISKSQYVIGEPVNVASAAWGGNANVNLTPLNFAGFGNNLNGVQNFSALVVPRGIVDAAVADGRITAGARDSLLDLQDPDDKARAYGQPLPSTGVADPNFNGGDNPDLKSVAHNTNTDGFRYTKDYFDKGGVVFTDQIEGSDILDDPRDFANTQDFIYFFDFENKHNENFQLRYQFFLEYMKTSKLSNYGFAIDTEQFIVEDKITLKQKLPILAGLTTYGISVRYTDAFQLQDFSTEPFSRRDIRLQNRSPNTIVAAGGQTDPNGVNFWPNSGTASLDSQLLETSGFFSAKLKGFNDRLNVYFGGRGEVAFFENQIPEEVVRATQETRDAAHVDQTESFINGSVNGVFKIRQGLNLYALAEQTTSISPAQGGGILGGANFDEAELYEGGLKANLLNNKLFVSTSFYYWDQSQFNARTGFSEPLRADGEELEFTWRPSERFTLTGAITNQRIYRRSKTAAFGALPQSEQDIALNGGLLTAATGSFRDLSNNPHNVFPGTPEVTAKLFATYSFANGFGFSVAPRYQKSFYMNFERTLKAPDAVIWDFNLFMRKKRWEVFFGIENAFSRRYFANATDPNFASNAIATLAQPISWNVKFKYKF